MATIIAIVEDDTDQRENYRDVLTAHGYEVRAYPDRPSAEVAFSRELRVEVGVRRTGGRSDVQDRFEAEEKEFKARVRSAYQQIAEKNPHRVETLDGDQPKEELCAQIKTLVRRRFGVAID